MTRRTRNKIMNGLFRFFFIVFIFLLFSGVSLYSQLYKQEVITFKVVEKPQQFKLGQSTSAYRLFVVTDKETFEIRNSLWNWEWDKSNRYYLLQEGKWYRARVCGISKGFFTNYRNILDYKEIEP